MPIMHGDRLLGVVHLSRTPRDIFQALKQEEHNVYWAAGLSLGLVAVVIIIVSLMIINPVKRLAKEANAVAEGRRRSLGRQTSPLVVRELTDLRLVVAEMAERLRHRSDYLKAFASGVSHEFKTPLAAIKGAMELLGEHGPNMPPETRARFENNILADLDRLERLVTQLLTLARAEAQAEDAPLLAQESQTEAAGLIQRLQTHYQATGYTVAAEGLRPLKLAISEDVLETVLRNLLDNSRDAGASRSVIELEVNPARRVGEIYVTDNGPGIPDELLDSIFQPFFTTKKNRGGTGLGLSLARTLLAPHRGELHLLESDEGAAFLISLPLGNS